RAPAGSAERTTALGCCARLLGQRPDPGPADAPATSTPSTPEPAADPEAVARRITEVEQSLTADGADHAALHEELGGLREQSGDPLEAITAYEASLEERPRYGESYNRLMDLYNTQRSQAAEAGDSAAINRWMSKIDELLATSKRIMRENY